MLRQHGLETTEVADGVEAIDQLRSHQFSAVFTDLEMPRVGGLEVLRAIVTTQETNHVPVVIVSSRDDETIQTEARELGASAYLTKPVVESQIDAVVKQLGLSHVSNTRGENN